MIRCLLLLALLAAGCGGAGNSEPVGLYQGKWRGYWYPSGSAVLELRIGRTGEVSGTFERSIGTLEANITGTLKKNGDLDVSYDSTGGSAGTLSGNLQFSGGINRLRGSLTRTEDEETTTIDVDLTRR